MDEKKISSSNHFYLKIRGVRVKLKKCQTEPYTKKILKQLFDDPKVVIYSEKRPRESVACHPSLDHNVPDISDIGNYVECVSTEEDIYINTNGSVVDKNVEFDKCANETLMTNHNGTVDTHNIEIELSKMFENDNEVLTVQEKKSDRVKKNSRKNRRPKHTNVKELIIQLFGSALDDIELPPPKPEKIQSNRRRHTLPVSINIPDKDFLPLKVSYKRRSEADVQQTSPTKVQKVQIPVIGVPRVLEDVEYTSASNLVVPTIYTETATVRTTCSDLCTISAIEKPYCGQCETVKAKESVTAFIDLTKDDSLDHHTVLQFDDIRIEIKGETVTAPKSSEKANVPVTMASMPLLSPVSPAEPTQAEAVLPQGTVTVQTMTAQMRPEVMQTASSHRSPPPPHFQMQRTSRKEQCTKNGKQPTSRKNATKKSPVPRQQPPQPNWQQQPIQIHIQQPESGLQQIIQLQATPMMQQTQHKRQTQQEQNLQQTPVYRLNHQKRQTQQQENGQQQKIQKINHSILEELTQWEAQKKQTPPQTVSNQGTMLYGNQNNGTGTFLAQPQTNSSFPNLKAALAPNQVIQQQAAPTTMQSTVMHQSVQQQPPQATPSAIQSMQQWLLQKSQQTQRQYVVPPAHAARACVAQNSQTPNLTSQPIRYPPQLLRLIPVEPILMSNTACGERIFPHVYKFEKWKLSAHAYVDAAKQIYTPAELRRNHGAFMKYTSDFIDILGKDLIMDLATVDVPNFAMDHVLHVISAKLVEKSMDAGIFYICSTIYTMIKACEAHCTTPFTKKFFEIVMACQKRLESKAKESEVHKFSLEQLKLLEKQIHQYFLIQNWMNIHNVPRGQGQASGRPKSPPPYPARPTKQVTPPNAHVQTGQALLDRPGRNDLVSVRSDCVPNVQVSDRPHEAGPYGQMPPNAHVQTSQALLNRLGRNDLVSARTDPVPNVQVSDRPHEAGPYGQMPPNARPYPASAALVQVSHASPYSRNMVDTRSAPQSVTAQKSPEANPYRVLGITAAQYENTSVSRPFVCSNTVTADAIGHSTSPAQANTSTSPAQTQPAKESQVPSSNQARVESVIAVAPPAPDTVKNETKPETIDGEIIDLTWIDDGDEKEILEEIIECKAFPFKMESCGENEEAAREAVSPVDSGLGSPVAQLPSDNGDGFKCLCGNRAIYICGCKSSMYCSEDCQLKDWTYHQRLCHKMTS